MTRIVAMPEETPEPDASRVSHHAAAEHRSATRWLTPIALVIAVVAAGLATWALLKPTLDDNPTAAGTQEQSGEAKARACKAYQTVSAAVALQTHADPGTDPASAQAVAANARLAMAGGAAYLLTQTSSSTPATLADTVHDFATGLQAIAMNALAGVPNDDPAQAARLRDAEAANRKIAELCK